MVDVAISVVWSKKMHRCIADIVFQKCNDMAMVKSHFSIEKEH